MMHNFTQNDLIRFLYKETNASESIAIGEALAEDDTLLDQYTELIEGYRVLPKVTFSPSTAAIQSILAHSGEAKPVGHWQ